MRKVIHGEIYSDNFKQLDKIVADWCSCKRFCFCRFQKDKLRFNDTRKKAKHKYALLNTRQISDAVMQAQSLYARVGDKKIIFGSRKSWSKLIKGDIGKEQWRERRDNQIYSRGDITKKGNPNIRVLDKKGALFIRVTIGNRRFEEYKLFIAAKFRQDLLSLVCAKSPYNVRLLKKGAGHYRVLIDYEAAAFVIARRGLGFNEKLSLYKYSSKSLKELVLDHAGDRTKRIHSWRLWRILGDNYKATLTASRSRMSGLKEPDDNLCSKGENPLGKDVSSELVGRCIND